jgi:NADPH:quinone reductase-like Zn-dependent oxidoreductase
MSTLVHKITDKLHKVAEHTSPEGQHLAAVQHEKGGPFVIEDRPTPEVGPSDVLIEVHCVAFNPVDVAMRDSGVFVRGYPVVLGIDASGVVLEVGSAVPTSSGLKPGTKVIALCDSFKAGGQPDRGAFQKKALVDWGNCAVKADWLSYTEAAKLPLAVITAWNGFRNIGIPRDTHYSKDNKKALLVWGASSSVGSNALQIAKTMGYHVYVTSGAHNAMYVKSLGATRVFDYKEERVVEGIVSAMKEDGVTLEAVFDAVGSPNEIHQVIKAMNAGRNTKVASAPNIDPSAPKVEGIETEFVQAPTDPQEHVEWFAFVMNKWLTETLEQKVLKASPKPKLVTALVPTKSGFKSIDDALDQVKKGVSGVKLVLEI